MDLETEFMQGLIELQYNQADHNHLKEIANQLLAYQGWPENPKSFWNAEAFMWSHKINKETREIIRKQLQGLSNNLDLGCGAYSYVPSTGLDLSEKMLNNNENCTKKIIGDLEQPLPLASESFTSATLIFVINYIENYSLLLSEINRILTANGKLIIVLSAHPVKELHRKQQKNSYSASQWVVKLEKHFIVNLQEKSNLLFFTCIKQKS